MSIFVSFETFQAGSMRLRGVPTSSATFAILTAFAALAALISRIRFCSASSRVSSLRGGEYILVALFWRRFEVTVGVGFETWCGLVERNVGLGLCS